jgi:ankyrin repeat protein
MRPARKRTAGALALLVPTLTIWIAFDMRKRALSEALAEAVAHDDAAAVRALLRKGADPNYRDRNGHQPIMCVAALRSTATLAPLLQEGGDPNAASDQGDVPIIWASGTGKLESVKLLLRSGAKVDRTDSRGTTALMSAARYSGSPEVVSELLSAGAKADMRTNSGETLVDLARIRLAETGPDYGPSGKRAVVQFHRARRREVVRLLVEAEQQHSRTLSR